MYFVLLVRKALLMAQSILDIIRYLSATPRICSREPPSEVGSPLELVFPSVRRIALFTKRTGHQFLVPRKIYVELIVITLLLTVGAVCASEVQPQMVEQGAEPNCVLTNKKPDC